MHRLRVALDIQAQECSLHCPGNEALGHYEGSGGGDVEQVESTHLMSCPALLSSTALITHISLLSYVFILFLINLPNEIESKRATSSFCFVHTNPIGAAMDSVRSVQCYWWAAWMKLLPQPLQWDSAHTGSHPCCEN